MGLKPYLPASKNPFSFNVFTPDSMAYEVQLALKSLKKKKGDLDFYVMDRLKYDDKEQLYRCLAAEQIDAVALAIHNVEQGQGMIIGDKTGIGKGRVAAAMIRYGVINCYPVVFFTLKSRLFSDIYRDLGDIESDDLVPFIFNNDADAEIRNPFIRGEDGKGKLLSGVKNNRNYDVVKSSNALNAKLDKQINEGRGRLSAGHDFVLTTYSQVANDFASAKAKAQKAGSKKEVKQNGSQSKPEFLRQFIQRRALMIMDESHESAGAESARGFYMREMLTYAKGAVYLSATFAKRADNMPVYGLKTAISDSGLTVDGLIETFEKGGVALQEVVAADLVKTGQMIRREHGSEGVEVIWKILEEKKQEHWDAYDQVTEMLRAIQAFQTDHVKPVIDAVNETLSSRFSAEERQGIKGFGVNNSDYFSRVGNTIRSLIFSLKAEDVAQEAINLLKQNKKVVIAFSRTMGSFLDDLGYFDGDVVDRVDFAAVLLKGLNSVFKYTVKDSDNDSRAEYVEYDDLSPSGQAAYDDLIGHINNETTGLPLSPIDTLINVIENTPRPKGLGGVPSKKFRVRECTGRNAQIRFEGGIPTYRRFKADINRYFAEFNSGEVDVLLINQSASTGVSCHSSEKFKDQRQRWMIIHEPELDINQEIQKRGRTNRTGQVNKPGYLYVSSTVPGEQRTFMVLKGKLKSLDANTTGSQQSSKNQLDVPDFMNHYGGQVIYKFLQENHNFRDGMGNPCYRTTKGWDGVEEEVKIADKDIPTRVTYRTQLLKVKDQDIFYKAILEDYEEFINELKDNDVYDLEVEHLPLDAKLERRFLFAKGSGGSTPFGRDAVIEQSKAKILKRPYRIKEINEKVVKYLNGKTPTEYANGILDDFKAFRVGYNAMKLKRFREEIEKVEGRLALKEVELTKVPLEGKDEKETLKFTELRLRKESAIGKLTNRVGIKNNELEAESIKLDMEANMLQNYLFTFQPGEVIELANVYDSEETIQSGIVLNWNIRKKLQNPYSLQSIRVTVAVNSSTMSKVFNLDTKTAKRSLEISESMEDQQKDYVKQRWDKTQSTDKRQTLFMATGNILKVVNKTERPKLVRYTTDDGAAKNGIYKGSAASNRQADIDYFIAGNPAFLPSVELTGMLGFIGNMQKGSELVLQHSPSLTLLKSAEYQEYYLIAAPKGNKGVLTDKMLLTFFKPSNEDERQGRDHGQFQTYTGNMQFGKVDEKKMEGLLTHLEKGHGITMLGQKPIELDITTETDDVEDGIFRYKLIRDYVPADYPSKHFMGYDQPAEKHRFGTVVYSQELNVKQRFTSGLIPVFDSIKQPYQNWRQQLADGDRQTMAKLLVLLKRARPADAIQKLGLFVFETSGEAGNPEFTFGEYGMADFGKLIFNEKIHEPRLKEMTKLISMIRLEMAA